MNQYRVLPSPDSTSKERLQALKDVKPILGASGMAGAIVGGSPLVDDLLRLADYVTVGHDYKDTHPEAHGLAGAGTLIMPHVIVMPDHMSAEDVAAYADKIVSRETSTEEGDDAGK